MENSKKKFGISKNVVLIGLASIAIIIFSGFTWIAVRSSNKLEQDFEKIIDVFSEKESLKKIYGKELNFNEWFCFDNIVSRFEIYKGAFFYIHHETQKLIFYFPEFLYKSEKENLDLQIKKHYKIQTVPTDVVKAIKSYKGELRSDIVVLDIPNLEKEKKMIEDGFFARAGALYAEKNFEKGNQLYSKFASGIENSKKNKEKYCFLYLSLEKSTLNLKIFTEKVNKGDECTCEIKNCDYEFKNEKFANGIFTNIIYKLLKSKKSEKTDVKQQD